MLLFGHYFVENVFTVHSLSLFYLFMTQNMLFTKVLRHNAGRFSFQRLSKSLYDMQTRIAFFPCFLLHYDTKDIF